jgi:hypothetical protein
MANHVSFGAAAMKKRYDFEIERRADGQSFEVRGKDFEIIFDQIDGELPLAFLRAGPANISVMPRVRWLTDFCSTKKSKRAGSPHDGDRICPRCVICLKGIFKNDWRQFWSVRDHRRPSLKLVYERSPGGAKSAQCFWTCSGARQQDCDRGKRSDHEANDKLESMEAMRGEVELARWLKAQIAAFDHDRSINRRRTRYFRA